MPNATKLSLFRELASSARPAGGEAEAAARRICEAVLTNRGFRTQERPFEYSAWPGLYGTPCAGLLLVLMALWMAREMGDGSVSRLYPFGVGLATLAAIVIGGWWMSRKGTSVFPSLRQSGVNLEAVRGDGAPVVWLVAHIDSKSQVVPMLLRISGVILCSLTWIAMLILWLVALLLHISIPGGLFATLAVAAAIGAAPLALCFTGSRGSGALDNASGVATILGAVDQIAPETPLGILITSAEELGLAGARAWLRGRPRAIAINCDSIDDTGRLVCMLSKDKVRSFDDALVRVIQGTGTVPIVRGIIPGILVDAIAFTDAGWSALTISRGMWGSLARIHTRRDTLVNMDGTGIAESARFVAALAGAVIARDAGSTSTADASLYRD